MCDRDYCNCSDNRGLSRFLCVTMSNLRFLLARSLASGIVRGGERPEFVDTSREENRPAGSKFTGWSKKQEKPRGDGIDEGDNEKNRTSEDLQRDYENLFQ